MASDTITKDSGMGVLHAGNYSLSTCSMQVMPPQLLHAHALLSTDLSAVLCAIGSSGSYDLTTPKAATIYCSRESATSHHQIITQLVVFASSSAHSLI
jgi:hypothetical protein